MKTLKYRNVFMLSRSLYVLVALIILSIPWEAYIYDQLLNNNALSIILVYLILYIIIYGIYLIFTLPQSFTITNKYVEKRFKLFFINRRKVLFFNNEKNIVRINTNFILSLFYLERLTIYTLDERKLFSLYVEKDESLSIVTDILKMKTDSKTPFKKNEGFYQDTKSIEALIYNSLLLSTISLLLFNLIFGFIINNIMRLVFIGILFFIFAFLLFILYNMLHSSNLISRVDENNIHMMKGVLFKNNYYLPKSKLDDVTIIGGPFSERLNTYTSIIKVSKYRYVFIPMNKENIEKDLNIILNKNNKGTIILPNLIIFGLLSIIVSVPIIIYNVIGGISILILLSFMILLFSLGSYIVIDGERLIIRTKFIISYNRIIRYDVIKKIKIKRSFRRYKNISFNVYHRSYNQIASSKDANELIKLQQK